MPAARCVNFVNRPKVCYSIHVRKNSNRRDSTMIYSFVLEGENVDGDLINYSFDIEDADSPQQALTIVEQMAINILEGEDGGHIDIFDIDGNFINDVEV